VRRHSKAMSSGSKARKPSGLGSSVPSGRLRLFLLTAIAAAFFLVPAAQAAAYTYSVNIEGSGSGTVEGIVEADEETAYEINCSGPPPTGECGFPFSFSGGGTLIATPSPGSAFAGWTFEGGMHSFGAGCVLAEPSGGECVALGLAEDSTVTATFECAEECGPSGPTNKRLLTLTKSGTGQGAVKSKPKGVSCGNTCPSAEASLYKETTVVLTAKAAVTAGSNLESWTGCESSTNTGTEGTCTVKMTEAKEVVAKFGGTSKALVNPKVLTVSKVDNGFETGFGTVKASGLACEADCTATEVEYFGGTTEPKVKAATMVTLTEAPVAGSSFTGWSGCDEEKEGHCIVSMSSAKSVTAEFAALPKNTLTLTKSGGGAIKSKPKGVACGNTCTGATASLSSDTTIVLSAKAATGSSLDRL
jgi:hypothetical protein